MGTWIDSSLSNYTEGQHLLIILHHNSRNLHDSMFWKILLTKMRFFHVNPVGRVLNRFSQDMALVDGQLITSTAYVAAVRCRYGFVKLCIKCAKKCISKGPSTFCGTTNGNCHLTNTYNHSSIAHIGILCSCQTVLYSKLKVSAPS